VQAGFQAVPCRGAAAAGREWSADVTGRRAHAVTLLELVLVISLLSLLVAFLWPNFESASRGERLDESGRRLCSLVAMCRAEAMNTARQHRIAIRPDGSLKVQRQVDPILAPQEYRSVPADWAQLQFLLDDVWIESIMRLPEGPPPVLVKDQLIHYGDSQFDFDLQLETVPVEQLEEPVLIDFEPDGTSDSLRWVLRDALGRGLQMTLDGRLGRVLTEPAQALSEGTPERPPAWEDAEEVRENQAEAEQEGGH
jgi:hypothetical protein